LSEDVTALRKKRDELLREARWLDSEIQRLEGERAGVAVGQIVRDKRSGRLGQVRSYSVWSGGGVWVDVWLVNKDGKVGNRKTFFGLEWEPVSGTDQSPPAAPQMSPLSETVA
jgi:hypothetical protein